jgi:hypothetical protein
MLKQSKRQEGIIFDLGIIFAVLGGMFMNWFFWPGGPADYIVNNWWPK